MRSASPSSSARVGGTRNRRDRRFSKHRPQPLSRREDGLLSSRSPLRLRACSEDSSVTEILRYAAFTDDPAGGNPAGVVLDASGLDETTMRAIAAEVGYSETAFVTSQANDTFA